MTVDAPEQLDDVENPLGLVAIGRLYAAPDAPGPRAPRISPWPHLDRWDCFLCAAHGNGGRRAAEAHYLEHHYQPMEES